MSSVPSIIQRSPRCELTYHQHKLRFWIYSGLFIGSVLIMIVVALLSLIFADRSSIPLVGSTLILLLVLTVFSFLAARRHDQVMQEIERSC